MISAKKSKAGIVCIIVSVFLLFFGVLAPAAMVVMFVFAVLLLIIGICSLVTSSRNFKKMTEWIAKNNVDGTIDRINNSITNGTATYYKKLKLILTSNELVSNSPSDPVIVKYEDISKAYRCNINGNQYDYNNQHICLDLKTGERIRVAIVTRARVPEEFGTAIGMIKKHLTTEGGLQ